jgi:radical SAM protein with 4Fe4S-binding SPASM domain
MLSVSNLLCNHQAGNESLRYGHVKAPSPAPLTPGPSPLKGEGRQAAPRPVVVWAVTKACNLRCVHCYASATPGPAPGELTHEEGIALLDDLRAFGVPAVLFSGGEPLVRPDTVELIGYAQSIGLTCTLSTNGLLIDDAMADRLASLGLRYAGISIDGIAPKHDKLRGMQGAFAGTLAAVDRCRARGIKVGVRFTVHALNEMDLDAIFDLCLEHDVQRLCVYHLAYAGRGGKMQKVDLTAAQTRAIVDRIFERTRRCHEEGYPLEVLTVDNHADAAYVLLQLEKEAPERAAAVWTRLKGTGGNRSGCNISAIDPVGNVHYDQFSWHYDCGNVRERPFSRIWSEAADPRLAVLRDRRAFLPERCQSCRFVEVCNGNLRTRAEAATGDWLGMDPSCYLTDAEIGLRQRELVTA